MLLPSARVSVERVDEQHGNVLKQYAAMGKPLDPTPAQVEQLNRETALPAPEEMKLQGGKLELTLTPNTLALVKSQWTVTAAYAAPPTFWGIEAKSFIMALRSAMLVGASCSSSSVDCTIGLA